MATGSSNSDCGEHIESLNIDNDVDEEEHGACGGNLIEIADSASSSAIPTTRSNTTSSSLPETMHMGGSDFESSDIVSNSDLELLNSFHDRCGRTITLSNNNRTASRSIRDFNHALVFSSEPLIDDVLFEIVIEGKNPTWGGSIEIGITSESPENMQIPSCAVVMRNGTWSMSGVDVRKDGVCCVSFYGRDLESLGIMDRVGVMVTSDDELIFYVNGRSQGVAAENIPKPVWALVDLYGSCVKVSLCPLVKNSSTTDVSATNSWHVPLSSDLSVVASSTSSTSNGFAITLSSTIANINAIMASYPLNRNDDIVAALPREQSPPPYAYNLERNDNISNMNFANNTIENCSASSSSNDFYDMNDRLRFHRRCGSLVKFTANCRTAERRRPLDEFNNGVVMTHRPLNDNELFEIRIDKLVDKWSGSIEVGVTTHNPSVLFFPATMTNMRSGTIMMSGCGILTNGKGTRRQYGEFNLDELREGDRVGMMRKSNSNLHYYINGQDQGVAATRVATILWGVIDLYGMTIKVTIVDRDERESQNLVTRRNNLSSTTALHSSSEFNVGGGSTSGSFANNAIRMPYFSIPSSENDDIISSASALHNGADDYAEADDGGLACGGSNLRYDDRLTFHPVCGTHATVARNGRKAYRPNPSDDFNNGVVLTRRPLRPNELFQVRLDRVVTKWAGSVELGVTTFSADELDFPFTMTNVRSGTWMMTGNGVMHNGLTVIEQYGQNLDRLQVGDRVGVVRKDDGTLHFWVNGVDQGPAAYNVPENVYGVIDLYGQAAQATIVDSSEVGSPDTANSTISNTALYSEPPLRFHSIHGKNAGITNGGLTAIRPNSQAEFNEAIVFGNRALRQRELFEIVIETVVPHWSGNIEIGIIGTRPEELQLAANATDLKAPDTTILCGQSIIHNTKTVRSNSMIDLDTLGVGARVGVMRIGDAIHFFINGVDQGQAAECRSPNIWPVVDLYGQCAQVSLTQQQPDIRAPYATSENSQSCQATSVIQPTSIETKHRWTCFSGNVNLLQNWTVATRGSGSQAALTQGTVFSEHPLSVGAPFEIKITSYNPMLAGSLSIGVTDLHLSDNYVRKNIPLGIKSIPANVWYLSGNNVCYNSKVLHRCLVSMNWLRKGDRISLELTARRTLRVCINNEDMHVNFQYLPSEVYVVIELAGSTMAVQAISYEGPLSPLRPFSLRLQDSLDFGGDSLNKQDSMLESIESENYEFLEQVHGTNINLLDNHKMAMRTQSFQEAMVFINKPLCRGDSISIKIEAIEEKWTGSIGLGVIGTCPQLFLSNNALSIPSNIMQFRGPCWLANDNLINIHGQIAEFKYGEELKNIKIGSIITMSLSHSGLLSILIIGKSAHNMNEFSSNLPNHVYPVFDLYGKCQKISLVSQSEVTQLNGTPILEEVSLELDKEQTSVLVKEVVDSIVQQTLEVVLRMPTENIVDMPIEAHNSNELNSVDGGAISDSVEESNAQQEEVELIEPVEDQWRTLINSPEMQRSINTPPLPATDNDNNNDDASIDDSNLCEWLRKPRPHDSTHVPEPARHTDKLEDGLRLDRQYTNRWDWMNQPLIQRYLNSPSSQLPCHSNIVEGAVAPTTEADITTTTTANRTINITTPTMTTTSSITENNLTTTTTNTTSTRTTTTVDPQSSIVARLHQRSSRVEKASYDSSEKSMLQMPRYDFSPPPPQLSTPSNHELNRSVLENLEDNLLRNLDIRRRTSENNNNNTNHNNNDNNTTSMNTPAIVPTSPSSSSSSSVCCLQESLQLQHNLNLNIQRSQSTQRFTNSFNALVSAATGIAFTTQSTTATTTTTTTVTTTTTTAAASAITTISRGVTANLNNIENNSNFNRATTSTSTISTMSTSATPVLTALEYFSRLREICRLPTVGTSTDRLTSSDDDIIHNSAVGTLSTSTSTSSGNINRRSNQIPIVERLNRIDSNREQYCNRYYNYGLSPPEVQMTENGLIPILGNRELESQNSLTIFENRATPSTELTNLITINAEQLNSLCDELDELCDDDDGFFLDPNFDVLNEEAEEEDDDDDDDEDDDDNDEDDENGDEDEDDDRNADEDDENNDDNENGDDDQEDFRWRLHVTDDSDDTDNADDVNERNNISDMDSDVNSNECNNDVNTSSNDNNDHDGNNRHIFTSSDSEYQHDLNYNFDIVRQLNIDIEDDDDLVEIAFSGSGSDDIEENIHGPQDRLREFTLSNISGYLDINSLPVNDDERSSYREIRLNNGDEKNVMDQNETEHKDFDNEVEHSLDDALEDEEGVVQFEILETTSEEVVEVEIEELDQLRELVVAEEILEDENEDKERLEDAEQLEKLEKSVIEEEEKLENKIIDEEEGLVVEEKNVVDDEQKVKVEELLIVEEKNVVDEERKVKVEEQVVEESEIEEKKKEKQTEVQPTQLNHRIYLTAEEIDGDRIFDFINPLRSIIVEDESDNNEQCDQKTDDKDIDRERAEKLGVSPLLYELMLLNEARRKAPKTYNEDDEEIESNSSSYTSALRKSCKITGDYDEDVLKNASKESLIDSEQIEIQNIESQCLGKEKEDQEVELDEVDVSDEDESGPNRDVRKKEKQPKIQGEVHYEAERQRDQVEDITRKTEPSTDIEQPLMNLPIYPTISMSSTHVFHEDEKETDDGLISDDNNWITEEEEVVVGESELCYRKFETVAPVSLWNGNKLPLDVPAESYKITLDQLLWQQYINCIYFNRTQLFFQTLNLPCIYVEPSKNALCFCQQCYGINSTRLRGWSYFKLNADAVNRKAEQSVKELEDFRGSWVPLYYMTSVEHVRTILDLGHLLPHDFYKKCQRSPDNGDVPKDVPSPWIELHVSPNAKSVPNDQQKLLIFHGQKYRISAAFEAYVRRQDLRRNDMTSNLNQKQPSSKPKLHAKTDDIQCLMENVQELSDSNRSLHLPFYNNSKNLKEADKKNIKGEFEGMQVGDYREEKDNQEENLEYDNDKFDYTKEENSDSEEEDDEYEYENIGDAPDEIDVNDTSSSLNLSIEDAIIEKDLSNGEGTEIQTISGLHINFRAIKNAGFFIDSDEEIEITEEKMNNSSITPPHEHRLNVAAIAASAVCDAPLKERIWYIEEAGACVITAVLFKIEHIVSNDEDAELQAQPQTSKKSLSSKSFVGNGTKAETINSRPRRRARARGRPKQDVKTERYSSSDSKCHVSFAEAIACRQRRRRKRVAPTAFNTSKNHLLNITMTNDASDSD